MSSENDDEFFRRRHEDPYTPRHPIPTVQDYRAEKEQRRAKAQKDDTQHKKENYVPNEPGHDVQTSAEASSKDHPGEPETGDLLNEDKTKSHDVIEDTSQAVIGSDDPKQLRKMMHRRRDDRAEREVTDPVTHLPVIVHDMTTGDFKSNPNSEPPVGSDHRTVTGVDAASKSVLSLQDEAREAQQGHATIEQLFPPPNFDVARAELVRLYQFAFTVGLSLIILAFVVLLLLDKGFGLSEAIQRSIVKHRFSGYIAPAFVFVGSGLGLGFVIIFGMQQWVENKVRAVWETELWEAERQKGKHLQGNKDSTSPQWLNGLLASVWPLINPDLFTSLADTLEVRHKYAMPSYFFMASICVQSLIGANSSREFDHACWVMRFCSH